MSAAKKNKFADLDRDGLIRACLELENENAQLRPKPALYKLGQVLAYGTKNPIWNGQPAAYFQVLSVENRMGKWHYGYQKSGIHGFGVFPEDKCRAITVNEFDGSQPISGTQAIPMEANTNAVVDALLFSQPAAIAPGHSFDNPEDF